MHAHARMRWRMQNEFNTRGEFDVICGPNNSYDPADFSSWPTCEVMKRLNFFCSPAIFHRINITELNQLSGKRLSNSPQPACDFRPRCAQLHRRRDPQRGLLALRLPRRRKENARRFQPFDRRGRVYRRVRLDFARRWLGTVRNK